MLGISIMVYKVFISHSTKDLGLVNIISGFLRTHGVIVYIAKYFPEPGKPLAQKIMENIKDSDCLLVLLSKDSTPSEWVQQEIGAAKMSKKLIIPLV